MKGKYLVHGSRQIEQVAHCSLGAANYFGIFSLFDILCLAAGGMVSIKFWLQEIAHSHKKVYYPFMILAVVNVSEGRVASGVS